MHTLIKSIQEIVFLEIAKIIIPRKLNIISGWITEIVRGIKYVGGKKISRDHLTSNSVVPCNVDGNTYRTSERNAWIILIVGAVSFV